MRSQTVPRDLTKSADLKAGEFYGSVPEKRAVGSSILSEVIHVTSLDVPAHSHELAYFTLVLGGGYSERFGTKMRDLEPMSVLWHRPGISHKDRISSNGARFFMIEVKREGMDALAQYASVPLDFAEFGTSVVWVAARLFREFKNWGPLSELVAEGLTLELLGQAARRETTLDKDPPKWLLQVVDRLHDEFSNCTSTSRLAEEAGVHPVHLASVFRRFHGQTIGEYTQRLRVSRASRLIIEGKLELAEIAYESGFADQSHFQRLFKRHTGMTPADFRRSLA
jgi:AraC family transcriptional regulator